MNGFKVLLKRKSALLKNRKIISFFALNSSKFWRYLWILRLNVVIHVPTFKDFTIKKIVA